MQQVLSRLLSGSFRNGQSFENQEKLFVSLFPSPENISAMETGVQKNVSQFRTSHAASLGASSKM
jgi:hypothetical protein